MISNFARIIAAVIGMIIFGMPIFVSAQQITDISGKLITIPDRPQRIILGESRMLYTLMLLQPNNPVAHIAGWPQDLAYYDPQSYRWFQQIWPQIANVPVVGMNGVASMNVEKVLALKPDLVILPALAKDNENEQNLVRILKRAGVPVVKIDLRVDLLHNTHRSVEILGQIFNQGQRAQQFNQFYLAQRHKITHALADYHGKRATVFLHLHLGRNNDCCITTVNGSLGQLITLAGGINVAASKVQGVFGRVSTEALLQAQPNFYFTTGMSEQQDTSTLSLGPEVNLKDSQQSYRTIMARQTGLNQLTAIQTGQGGLIWHNFYLSPWHIVAAEFIAKTLYPQLFANLDPNSSMAWLLSFARLPVQGVYFTPLAKLTGN